MENEINPTHESKMEEVNLTLLAINYLQKAAPWIKFIGVLGFIGSAILLLVAGYLFFMPLPFPSQVPVMPGFGFISIVYVVLAIVTFFPSLYMFNYGNKLSAIKYAEDTEATIEKAFMWQKKYWVFIGVFMIVYTGIVFIVVAGALIAVFALNAF